MQALHEVRTRVNGKFLPQFSGKPVTILGQVSKMNPNGSTFEMKALDNSVVNIIMNEPLQEPLDGWVEVRGVGQGKTNVICHHYIALPKEHTANIDSEQFNDLISIINTCNNPWVNAES